MSQPKLAKAELSFKVIAAGFYLTKPLPRLSMAAGPDGKATPGHAGGGRARLEV
jgi:hypothetical protein